MTMFLVVVLTGERSVALRMIVALVVVPMEKKELPGKMVGGIVIVHMKEREPVLKMVMAPVQVLCLSQGVALMVVELRALQTRDSTGLFNFMFSSKTLPFIILLN